MILAIDYDDTYTLDPAFWNSVVEQALALGHTVYCVTSRRDTALDDIESTLGMVLPDGHIIACNMLSKRMYTQSLGIMVDVWIDDNPETIGI